MATTTNFGWETPDDTDLVKDGAAAMRTLGNSIDTSFVDLKGGTTGQILAKASNTDLDYTWITNDVGDITAVTAGTGLTGGGTSGAVSLALDTTYAIPPTIVDAKGDIIAATAADTVSRLAVGTNGQILTADSTTATGLKWASASGSFNGASAYSTATQNISTATTTTITFNNETFDTNNYHDTATNNSRLTVPSTGKYLLNAFLQLTGNSTGYREIAFLKNSTTQIGYLARGADATTQGFGPLNLTQIVELNANDYVQIQVYQSSGTTLSTTAGQIYNWFQIQYLGA